MKRAVRPALILVLIAVTTILHYSTPTERLYLHEIYQRVYYIPILLAAFWYGPFGGLAAATLTSLYYGYHIHQDWAHVPAYSINQWAEIVLYYLVGLITGALAERQRREERKLQAVTEELRNAYDELQHTSHQLRRSERLAALGALTAGIAHEIRNPLGSIKGAVEIIDRSLPGDYPKREFIEIIQEEISRLNSTLTQFLQFGNPQSTRLQPVSLNQLVESTIRLLRQKAEAANAEIQTRLDPSLPDIRADSDQLRHVLINLVINGVEAMPEGGTLTVRTRSRDGRGVLLQVRDEGQGMSGGTLETAFDPFFTTKTSGMGLGLSISHQLVQNHAGSISLQPNPEKGLTVTVELPVDPEAEAET